MSTRWDTQEVPPQTGEGAEADSPLELTPPDWKQSVRRALKEFKNDRAGIISAGMAFYWFLAIFPSLLALVGILGLVNAEGAASGTIADAARSALPGDAASVLTDALDKAAAGSNGAAVVATLVGVALALWGASAGMVALQTGLGVAYDASQVEIDDGRGGPAEPRDTGTPAHVREWAQRMREVRQSEAGNGSRALR